MSNITGIPKAEASDLRKILDQMTRTMPEQIEVLQLLARLDFEKFKALQAAGFKAEQAMDLMRAEKIKASI